MVVQISTGLTADVEEEVAQDQGLVDAEDAQGRDQVLEAEVAGDVARHRSPDPAAAHHATAREAEADQQHATARGVEAVTTRNRGLAPLPVTAGADQSPEAETRRKRRRNQGASLGRRRTRAGTNQALGMDRPPLERSLVPDLRQHRRPSSLLCTVDCDSSSKLHHRLCSSVAEEKQLVWPFKLLCHQYPCYNCIIRLCKSFCETNCARMNLINCSL